MLQREKRVSYRALKRRFDLDDGYLKDLKIEIIEAKQLAIDENGRILVWTGNTASSRTPSPEPLTREPVLPPAPAPEAWTEDEYPDVLED
ncbi:MAG: hypothetical protein V3S24_05645 [Candidatus Tectomicrobia bacterium]